MNRRNLFKGIIGAGVAAPVVAKAAPKAQQATLLRDQALMKLTFVDLCLGVESPDQDLLAEKLGFNDPRNRKLLADMFLSPAVKHQ